MSLNFDVKKVKNYDEVTTAWRVGNMVYLTEEEIPKGVEPTRIWHPVTEAIIYRTMGVGLGSVSVQNIPEFYARSRMFDLMTDSMPLIIKGKDSPLTIEMLIAHIGLTTNVRDETRSKWQKRIFDYEFQSFFRLGEKEFTKLAKEALEEAGVV